LVLAFFPLSSLAVFSPAFFLTTAAVATAAEAAASDPMISGCPLVGLRG